MTYVIIKLTLRSQKDEVLDLFEDYIRTKEGQESFYLLGMLFGKGVQQGIGLKGKLKGGKIMGMPAEFVMGLIEKFAPGLFKGDEKKISEERPSTPSGKFD